MNVWYKVSYGHRGWIHEAYLDWTCLMVGVNWALPARTGGLAGFYIHLGPIVVGFYRWTD